MQNIHVPVTGTVSGLQMAQDINLAIDSLQGNIGGILTKNVGGAVDVTLTASEANNGIIILTGVLTAHINVFVPASAMQWEVINNTSGAFTITFKATGGTGKPLLQGYSAGYYCNGTNVEALNIDERNGLPTTFTSSGTAPAYTLASPLGPNVAYAAGQRHRIKFNANGTTGSNTFNRDGLGAVNLKQYDSAGAKISAVIASGQISDIEHDGTDFVVLNSLPEAGALTGFRNRITNGDMRIDRRNEGASQTFTAAASEAYCVDRFYGKCTGANVTGQRVAGSGVDQYLYQFTGAGSVTGIVFGQRIEATNIYDLLSTTATFSVEISNSLLTTVTWTAYYPTASDNYASKTQIATGTFTVNSTLTKYSANIALGANVDKGLCIELSVGAQTSGTWKIGEFQLEAGSSATAFERRPVAIEQALCSRYYRKFSGISSSVAMMIRGYGPSGGEAFSITVPFGISMRSSPSCAVFGSWALSNATGPNISGANPEYATLYMNLSGAGDAYAFANGTTMGFTASSEL